MGYKTIIGVGQANYDSIILGQKILITNAGSSYNAGTGVVTLTLASNLPGGTTTVSIDSLAGTGANLSSADGTFTVASGAGTATITYTIAAGLTITTITGGNLNYGGQNNGNSFTAFGPVGGAICTAAWSGATISAAQANVKLFNHTGYTSSRMRLLMTSNTANKVINHSIFVNNAKGNQLLAILTQSYPNLTAIVDSFNTDVVPGAPPGSVSPVTVQFSQGWGTGVETGGTGTTVFSGVYWIADQPGGASVPWSVGVNGPAGNPSTGQTNTTTKHMQPIAGGSCATANTGFPGQAQVYIPTGGVWNGLQIYQNAPIVGGAATVSTLQACVDGAFLAANPATARNQVVNIPANNPAGVFEEDATHSDIVTAGSYVCTQIFNPNGPPILNWSAHGSTWTSSAPNIIPLTAVNAPFTSNGQPWQTTGVGYTMLRFFAAASLVVSSEEPAGIPLAGTSSGMNPTFAVAGTPGAGAWWSAWYLPSPLSSALPGNQTGPLPANPGSGGPDMTHSDAVPAGAFLLGAYNNMAATYQLASHSVAFATPIHNPDNMSLLGVG